MAETALAPPFFFRRALETVRPRQARLRDRPFWVTQALMAVTTALLYTSNAVIGDVIDGGLHDIPVMFLLVPVLYATFTYGFEGAVLTSLWTVVLVTPYSAIYSREQYEWLGDMGILIIISVTSLTLAIRVEREQLERERAEAALSRLALLNEIGRALAPARSVPQLLHDFVRTLQSGLRLDTVAALSVVPGGAASPLVIWGEGAPLAAARQSLVDALAQAAQHDAPRQSSDGWLFAPMTGSDRPLGAVAARRAAGPLTVGEREVLVTAVRQAGVAIDNLRLELEHRGRLVSYARQVTNAQEEEQRRIARELHDGVTQTLAGLCRGLDLLREEIHRSAGDPDATATTLRSVAEESLQDLRRLTRDLRPTILDDLGLVPGIEWLTSELAQRLGIEVRCVVRGETPDLSAEQELTVFRIAQETMRNTEKHARAAHIAVILTSQDDILRMRIKDDGCGFVVSSDTQDLASRGAYGLLGMEERATLNGGVLTVHSTPGRGTVVELVIAPEGVAIPPEPLAAPAI